jgi:hypothetical protein
VCVDHIIPLGERHLRAVLLEYVGDSRSAGRAARESNGTATDEQTEIEKHGRPPAGHNPRSVGAG